MQPITDTRTGAARDRALLTPRGRHLLKVVLWVLVALVVLWVLLALALTVGAETVTTSGGPSGR